MAGDSYYQGYEKLEMHELMLQDTVRNKAYRDAIFNNRAKIQDKVVLDVGTGSGFLAILCAQAGARKVYAVEASSIYQLAEQIVIENGFEHIIQVIHAQIEELELPQRVDVIISEWMGFYLLHESMIESVIWARDKFLKEDGIMMPEMAVLYCSPCSVPTKYDYWNSVEGVSMRVLGEKLRQDAFQKPVVDTVQADWMLAHSDVLCWLDMREVNVDTVRTIQTKQLLVCNKQGRYQGLCLWFCVIFPGELTEPITLTTEPCEPLTHWKQTLVVLPVEMDVEEGTPLAYDIKLERNIIGRGYTIHVEMLDSSTVEHPEYCQCHQTKCILVRALLDKYERDAQSNIAVTD